MRFSGIPFSSTTQARTDLAGFKRAARKTRAKKAR
jgi:hypothetical protein